MNVVYKKTMLECIRDARHEARFQRKEIEKIVLTIAETRKLIAEIEPTCYVPMADNFTTIKVWMDCLEVGLQNRQQPGLKVMGIDIEVQR
jgi:hypothetical protein